MRTETRKMQYLYDSGDAAVFMDNRDYEQIEIPREVAGEAMRWVLPNAEVEVLFVDERPSDVQVPSAVEMKVTQTEPGVKGDTASGGGTKPATLESGVDGPGAALHRGGRDRPRRHPQRRVRLARVSSPEARRMGIHAPVRPTPRRRLRLLPARRDRAPARGAARRRAAVHAGAGRGVEAHRDELDAEIAAPRQGLGRWTGSRRSTST